MTRIKDRKPQASKDSTRLQTVRPVESIAFLLTGIVLYFVSDWLLQRAEAVAGRRFEHRTLIFFGLLLGLALVSFSLLGRLGAG